MTKGGCTSEILEAGQATGMCIDLGTSKGTHTSLSVLFALWSVALGPGIQGFTTQNPFLYERKLSDSHLGHELTLVGIF